MSKDHDFKDQGIGGHPGFCSACSLHREHPAHGNFPNPLELAAADAIRVLRGLYARQPVGLHGAFEDFMAEVPATVATLARALGAESDGGHQAHVDRG